MDIDSIMSEAISAHKCTAQDGVLYWAAQYIREQPGRFGEVFFVRVFASSDNARTWMELPMKLTLPSRLWAGWFATWPPEGLDDFGVCDEGVFLVFRDKPVEYEKPTLPFGLDSESIWRASYSPETSRWKLKRLGNVPQ